MANVCTNMFYAQTNNVKNYKLIISFLESFEADIFLAEENIESESFVDSVFYSKWVSPTEKMEVLIEELEDDPSLYIRILSHEFINEYASFDIYKNGKWDNRL